MPVIRQSPPPPVYWNHRLSAKLEINLWGSTAHGQNLEPQGVRFCVWVSKSAIETYSVGRPGLCVKTTKVDTIDEGGFPRPLSTQYLFSKGVWPWARRECIFATRLNYASLYLVYTAKPASKSKSAMETLVDSFSDLVTEAKERMSPEEFRQAEKEFDEIIDKARARASRGGRRETA